MTEPLHIIPPFEGTRVLDPVPFEAVEALLDREALFASRWQFRQGQDATTWEQTKAKRAIPLLERLLLHVKAQDLIQPKAIYGYYRCTRESNGLIIVDGERSFRIDFPRERETPNRCLADFFESGVIAIQVAGVGKKIGEVATREHAQGRYSEAFFLSGLAAQFAEATAAYVHGVIRRELKIPEDQGERFSPGYPAFPDLMAQRKLMTLLAPMRIGIALSKTCQLIPEYSTSAIVSVDPQACYFRP